MIIKDSIVYNGKNIYAYFPVIRLTVDLEGYEDIPTKDIKGFNENLVSKLEGVKNHYCSLGYKGGFVKRLEEGTYLAHVCEHMILELQSMLGYDLSYGKTRVCKDGSYHIIYAYESKVIGTEVATLAVHLINSFILEKNFDLEKGLKRIREKSRDLDLGSSTKVIVEEARKMGVPVNRIGEDSIIQLGYGKNLKLLEATLSEKSSCVAVDIACHKSLAKDILYANGIEVPQGKLVHSIEEALDFAEYIGYPVVIKPNFGSHGLGVSINLQNPQQVKEAYEIATQIENTVIVENFVEGKHYRFLVVGDQCVAVAQRLPAHVIGNGYQTIAQLIELENQNVLRGVGHEKALTKIEIDDVVLKYLEKNGLYMEMKPEMGKVVFLRENDNLSTGGIAIDVTDEVCEENKEYAIRAAQLIGIDIAGIDITAKDIHKPLGKENGGIIEINAAPGIRMHHYPSMGKARNVAHEIVKWMAGDKGDMTIPIVSVTGTNGKTTTTRMISHILQEQGYRVGMTSTSGIYINHTCIKEGDNSGAISARTILNNQTIDYAVLETARGGIVKRGLGYQNADVGILTNVTEDHLGLDEIDTLEDLTNVKSLVVEAIKPGGYAVLNADDENCVILSKTLKAQVLFFSLQFENVVIQNHIAQGGTVVYQHHKRLYIQEGEKRRFIANTTMVPITMGGTISYNVSNTIAAIAGAYGIGVPLEAIKQGIKTFVENPGRFNVFEVDGVKIVLDYGHNIDGYLKTIEALKKQQGKQLIGVIGVPGDRSDESVKKVGALCGSAFHKIYIKEDKDRRGKAKGETAELLRIGVESTKKEKTVIQIELDEVEALEKAFVASSVGDIIIVYFEDAEALIQKIKTLSKSNLKSKDIVA